MIKLNSPEGARIAKSLLLISANRSDEEAESIHELVLKLMDGNMGLLATFAADVFDQTGDFPNIFPVIKKKSGVAMAGEFSTFVMDLRRQRIAEGKSSLNVIFVDEDGVAENVLFMADFQHLRKKAA